MYDVWLTSTSYEGRFDGEGMAWHGPHGTRRQG
jgi:hypothetical protein